MKRTAALLLCVLVGECIFRYGVFAGVLVDFSVGPV